MALSVAEARRRVIEKGWRPRNVVWEITLACNLRCGHCGSRAGAPRHDELSLDECLAIVAQLDALGTERITLSGGEPTVREDWDVLARAIADRGIYVNMVTNGVYRSDAQRADVVARAKAAGMCNVGVSLDGPREVHDQQRGRGAYDKTIATIEAFAAAGLRPAIITTVDQRNLALLPSMRQPILDAGAEMWRFQLAKPMGNMADQREHALEPRQVLELLPALAEIKKQGKLTVYIGDSVGYYGPYDKVLRNLGWRGRKESWQGCQAGMRVLGIEADGAVKGCLSMQACAGADDPFVEGNLRERSLTELWHAPGAFAYNRDFEVESLTGACARCRKASVCRGGAHCAAMAFSNTLSEYSHCTLALTGESQPNRLLHAAQPAAAAAAALLLAMAPMGCDTKAPSGDEVKPETEQAEPIPEPEYAAPMPEPEPRGIQEEYGIPRPMDEPVEPVSEYGIEEPPPAGAGKAPVGDEVPSDYAEYGAPPPEEPVARPAYGVMRPEPEPEPEPTAVDEYGIREPEPSMANEYGIREPMLEPINMAEYAIEEPPSE